MFLHSIMNKATAFGLSLASAIYAAIAPADYSYAQGKTNPPGVSVPQPIKFDDDKKLEYKISPFTSSRAPRSSASNYGTIYYRQDGGFKSEGALNGTVFDYNHQHGMDGGVWQDMLILNKDDSKVIFYDYPSQGISNDSASVNGVKIDLGSPGFYEGKISAQKWDKMNERERLLFLFRDWKMRLNVEKVKAEAERLKTPKEELRESLDEFVAK